MNDESHPFSRCFKSKLAAEPKRRVPSPLTKGLERRKGNGFDRAPVVLPGTEIDRAKRAIATPPSATTSKAQEGSDA